MLWITLLYRVMEKAGNGNRTRDPPEYLVGRLLPLSYSCVKARYAYQQNQTHCFSVTYTGADRPSTAQALQSLSPHSYTRYFNECFPKNGGVVHGMLMKGLIR